MSATDAGREPGEQAPSGRGRDAPDARRERDGDRDRERRRSRSRDRDAGRDRDRGGRDDRERRDRDRGAGGAAAGGGDRRRSRSRSYDGDRHRRERSRSRDRSRRDDRDRRGDDRRDDRGSGGGGGKERKIMSKEEQEIMDLTRDARTIFVSQMVVRATERDVEEFFEQVGPVQRVSLIKDKHTQKSKGYGYVEFSDLESVPKALLLNGQKFCMKHPACVCSGFPIAVKPSEAEKNYAAMAEAAGGSTLTAGIEKRVYLCGLPPGASEGDIRKVAEMLGHVEKVSLIRDDRGNSRGYGYVNYSSIDAANSAMTTLHGIKLGGKEIKVGKLNAVGQVVAHTGETFPLDGGAGGALTAQARAALMAQLSSATSAAVQQMGASLIAAVSSSAPQPSPTGGYPSSASSSSSVAHMAGGYPGNGYPAAAGAPVLPSPAAMAMPGGAPTTCILLMNMFDPAQETEPNWDQDIRDEVAEECSKHGRVLHAYADKYHPQGQVYLMFADVGAAMAAAAALGGRKFAGRIIAVEYIALPDYLTRFPEAASRMM